MRAVPGHPQPHAGVTCATVSQAEPGERTFTIGELAQEFRLTLRTLRFYETKGFLTPHRTGTERHYTQTDRDRIAFIVRTKELGFTLREIGELIASRECAPDVLQLSRRQCTEQINLLERQKRSIEKALSELRRIYSDRYLHALRNGELDGA